MGKYEPVSILPRGCPTLITLQIPGHHFVPLMFTSLAVYLSSMASLSRDTKPRGRQTNPQKRTSGEVNFE